MGWLEEKVEHKLEHVARAIALEGEMTRDSFAAALEKTLRGLRVDGALARPIRPNALTYAAGGRLVGWSLRAATADVTVTFHDGATTDADPVATVVIPAGTSSNLPIPGVGVAFVDGLYVEVTSTGAGTVTGAVWIGAT